MATDPLDIIEQRESRGRNVPNYKYGPGFTASGNFQIINETWRRWAQAAGIDISQYPTAMSAPYDVQRQVAAHGYRTEGFKPWEATKHLVGQESSYAPPGVISAGGTAAAPKDPTPSTPWTTQDLSAYYARKGIDTSGFGGALNKGIYTMLQNAPPELKNQILISSGYRSPDYQAKLYADAVKKYGSEEAARKWVAPPGRSQHGFGNAADLQFKTDAARAWAHENAAKYGLAFPLGNEPWHVEAAGARAGGKPVNYALGVEGGQPSGTLTAQGEAPNPLTTTFETSDAAFQQGLEAAKAAQAAQAPKEPILQTAAAPAAPMLGATPQEQQGQVQAADLMGSILAARRAKTQVANTPMELPQGALDASWSLTG